MMSKYLKLPDITQPIMQLESIVELNIERLERMINTITAPPEIDIDNLIRKLEGVMNGSKETLSDYEILLLSFNCAKLKSDSLSFFLAYVPNENKNLDFLKGLIFSLIRGWNNDEIRHLLVSYIIKNKSLLSKKLADCSRFFLCDDGPQKLGAYIKNNDVMSAPAFICIGEEWISSPYFEQVIIEYFKYQQISKATLDIVTKILNKINEGRFSRLLLPSLVIRVDKTPRDESIREDLINKCKIKIGEVSDSARWTDNSFDEKQTRELLNCRNIIKKWQVEKAVIFVYDKLGKNKYPERKELWLSFTHIVDKFKVYSTEYLSKKDKFYFDSISIGPQLIGPSNTALLMRIGNWTIVELLEGGCAYFYKDEEGKRPNMAKKVWCGGITEKEDLELRNATLLTAEDVKNHNIHLFPNDIKIHHKGKWQERFLRWMTQKNIVMYNDIPNSLRLRYL